MRLGRTRTATRRYGPRHAAGGFNLLPWRPREMQRLRRRRVVEWGAAALVGCACAAPLAGWEMWQRSRVEARRLVVEASAAQLRAPLTEAQRLLSAAAAQRSAAQLAQQRGKPLARMLALLDGLARAGPAGVVLQQIVQHGDETELQASVADEPATAKWLARLRAVRDVEMVSVRELKRTSQGANAKVQASPIEPIRVIARIAWQGTTAPENSAESPLRKNVRNPE